MIINKFGFRSNIKSVNLSGMGCSAGILSIYLAKDLLKVHKNSLALVLSMEAVTPNGYAGKKKSMLLPNILFRMGGAAILLSNRKQDKGMAKYKLEHLVQTHIGSDDEAYQSVFQKSDEDGVEGVSLSRALLNVATKALKTNISSLGPLVLPHSEQLRFAWSMIPVIDGIEQSLKLQKEDGEASRMTLHRFGNTSSSSIWYELCYLETKGRVKKGNKVWQIAFGSGFKCNTAVWRCISDVDPTKRNAWSDSINLYPIIDDEIPN
ncbi:putative very-long-chain 3-oxoacyl-CoA synthase [Rosa chinensis]|uniref:very-long-chain 3-oxoacyl-CoA synthase n=1 Tax=Rosa chinensis TaxID=74649 RepID=A0A2P6PD88_ROSCH|nr:putative very-long-chain 3-oxoacyl-CoA synthase [Rosa chinensis]